MSVSFLDWEVSKIETMMFGWLFLILRAFSLIRIIDYTTFQIRPGQIFSEKEYLRDELKDVQVSCLLKALVIPVPVKNRSSFIVIPCQKNLHCASASIRTIWTYFLFQCRFLEIFSLKCCLNLEKQSSQKKYREFFFWFLIVFLYLISWLVLVSIIFLFDILSLGKL